MDAQTLRTYPVDIKSTFSLNSLEEALARITLARCKYPNCQIHFNLSTVRWFDIGSILFLICVLSRLKRQGVPILLTLPESAGQWGEGSVRKARDYLLRWHFVEALNEAVGDYREILPPHQEDYFDAPLQYYKEGRMPDTVGVAERLLSCKLVEITHMTWGPPGSRRVTEEEINSFLDELSLQKRFRHAVCGCLGFSEESYKRDFSGTIIREALLNTFEHPEASISMIAMAREANHLVIAIADNGLIIPETIRRTIEEDEDQPEQTTSEKEDLKLLKLLTSEADNLKDLVNQYKSDFYAIDYAARPWKTSKKNISRWRRGLGLTYVKNKTLEYGGYCIFRAGAASVRYFIENGQVKSGGKAVSWWPGNLIKILLPFYKAD